MSRTPEHVLTVSDCPVTPGAELLLVLVSIDSGRPVFWCPDCGSAWHGVPPTGAVDPITALSQVAPGGVRLATEDDLVLVGVAMGNRRVQKQPYAHWRADLDAVLKAGQTRSDHLK